MHVELVLTLHHFVEENLNFSLPLSHLYLIPPLSSVFRNGKT